MSKLPMQTISLLIATTLCCTACGGRYTVTKTVKDGTVTYCNLTASKDRKPIISAESEKTNDAKVHVKLEQRVNCLEYEADNYVTKKVRGQYPNPILGIIAMAFAIPFSVLFAEDLVSGAAGVMFGKTIKEDILNTEKKNPRPTGNYLLEVVPLPNSEVRATLSNKHKKQITSKKYQSDDKGTVLIDLPPLLKEADLSDRLTLELRAKIGSEEGSEKVIIDEALLETLEPKLIDMSAGISYARPRPVVNVYLKNSRDLNAKKGQSDVLMVKVTNRGFGDTFQLRGRIKSENKIFNDMKPAFGRISQGQTRISRLPFSLPKNTKDTDIPLEIEFQEYHGNPPSNTTFVITVVE